MVDSGPEKAIDERIDNSNRVSLSRDEEFGSRFVECFDPELFPTEQDCIREAMKREIERSEEGCSLEDRVVELIDKIDELMQEGVPVRVVEEDS